MFDAIVGFVTDGHKYIESAIQNGANDFVFNGDESWTVEAISSIQTEIPMEYLKMQTMKNYYSSSYIQFSRLLKNYL